MDKGIEADCKVAKSKADDVKKLTMNNNDTPPTTFTTGAAQRQTAPLTPSSALPHYETYILRPSCEAIRPAIQWTFQIEQIPIHHENIEMFVLNLGPRHSVVNNIRDLLPEELRLVTMRVNERRGHLVSVHRGRRVDLATTMGRLRVRPVVFVLETWEGDGKDVLVKTREVGDVQAAGPTLSKGSSDDPAPPGKIAADVQEHSNQLRKEPHSDTHNIGQSSIPGASSALKPDVQHTSTDKSAVKDSFVSAAAAAQESPFATLSSRSLQSFGSGGPINSTGLNPGTVFPSGQKETSKQAETASSTSKDPKLPKQRISSSGSQAGSLASAEKTGAAESSNSTTPRTNVNSTQSVFESSLFSTVPSDSLGLFSTPDSTVARQDDSLTSRSGNTLSGNPKYFPPRPCNFSSDSLFYKPVSPYNSAAGGSAESSFKRSISTSGPSSSSTNTQVPGYMSDRYDKYAEYLTPFGYQPSRSTPFQGTTTPSGTDSPFAFLAGHGTISTPAAHTSTAPARYTVTSARIASPTPTIPFSGVVVSRGISKTGDKAEKGGAASTDKNNKNKDSDDNCTTSAHPPKASNKQKKNDDKDKDKKLSTTSTQTDTDTEADTDIDISSSNITITTPSPPPPPPPPPPPRDTKPPPKGKTKPAAKHNPASKPPSSKPSPKTNPEPSKPKPEGKPK